jgi:hypothetical protein
MFEGLGTLIETSCRLSYRYKALSEGANEST